MVAPAIRRRLAFLVATVLLAATGAAAREPVIGGPCEGCELVFVGLPGDLDASARIAPEGAEGEPMVIEGTVRDAAGRPAPGVLVYAYHTDAGGIYPPGETDHGRFRAWIRTGEDGRYRFTTIRPGAYPSRRTPQHVHLHIIEPGCCTYWINSIVFADDPLLSDARRRGEQDGRGGSGLVDPRRDEDGVWRVERDIVLGRNVPGYPR